jgi:Fic family protein
VGVSWVPSLQKDAAARLAHGSTAIEGNPLTLKEVKILADGGDLPHAKPRAVQEVLNYFNVLRFIDENSKIEKISEKDVLKLHSILGQRNALDRGPIGSYRNYGVRVGDHIAPPAKDVSKLMKEFLEWLSGRARAWPAVIAAAILHYRFEIIHPFGDGNGRVGRALVTWELYRREYDTHHIFALDEVILDNRQSYYRAFQRVRQAEGDLTGWVEYFSEAVSEALGQAWKRIEVVKASKKNKRLTLTPKQEHLLSVLRSSSMTIGDIQRELKVTKPGAHHVLRLLLKAGLIKRIGSHRHGKYKVV